MRKDISKSSEAIRGHQMSSVAIGGHQRPSYVFAAQLLQKMNPHRPLHRLTVLAAITSSQQLPHVSVVSVLSPRASNWRVLMAASSLIT
jgi:hypothetical protein